MDIFSRRNQPKSKPLRYDLPRNVRSRIIHNLDQSGRSISNALAECYDFCLREYGAVESTPRFVSYDRPKSSMALEHFENCTDERAIDFIEMIFRSHFYLMGKEGVEIVNSVLREEGIGYEFSPWVMTSTPHGNGYYLQSLTYPQATIKTEERMHAEVIMPALLALADPRFKTANNELLAAHRHLRTGEWEAAITAAGQAFESVFKVILTAKHWSYDQKDVLSKLIEIAKSNNLFPTFYVEIFKNVGTLRNNLGGHGGGTPAAVKPEAMHADNVVQLVSAHTMLLIRMANL